MILDHVFMLIDPVGNEIDDLKARGLTETYRRSHPGQGTQNVCFCFDNLFLELLWISNLSEVHSESIARTRLYERSRWKTEGINPFGLAWREPAAAKFTLPTWGYMPPYLPAGMSIQVAKDSDDPQQPMMFRSPGMTAPIEWSAEKRGSLQHSAGLGNVLAVDLDLPPAVRQSDALKLLAASTMLNVGINQQGGFALRLTIERRFSEEPLVLKLPTSDSRA
jgi:Glyoxalase-like domain